MMRELGVCLMLTVATAAAASQPAAPPLSGSPALEIETVEKAFDGSIRGYSIDAPLDHLLPTHGIFVEGYGAVFVTDVNLVSLPPLFGFGGRIAKGELSRIHDSKLKRLPEVRKLMTQMVLAASGTLAHLSPDEHILLQFNFYSLDLEDRTGLPKLMSVQGKKKDLLDAAARKIPDDLVSSILKVRVE
jgi:hypothetical protein